MTIWNYRQLRKVVYTIEMIDDNDDQGDHVLVAMVNTRLAMYNILSYTSGKKDDD